jgi:hypothetical protein
MKWLGLVSVFVLFMYDSLHSASGVARCFGARGE